MSEPAQEPKSTSGYVVIGEEDEKPEQSPDWKVISEEDELKPDRAQRRAQSPVNSQRKSMGDQFDFQVDSGSSPIDFQPDEKSPAVQRFEDQIQSRAIASIPKPPIPGGLQPTKSLLLSPQERTGTHMTAAPNDDLQGREAAAGRLIPESAVAPLAWFQRNVNDPLDRMAAKGAEVGRKSFDPISPYTDQEKAALKAQGVEVYQPPDWAVGVGHGVGAVAGGMVADPRNWPFLASSAARPILQRLISGGFGVQMGKGAVEAATNLYQNWDRLSVQQRAELITSGGISSAMAAGALSHALSPEVADAVSSMSQAHARETQAAMTVRGIPIQPLTEPIAPPAPQEQVLPHISPELVGNFGARLASLPPDQRAQAIIDAHGELSKNLLQQGKVVGPDGRLQVIKSADQADTLAQSIINAEITRQDQEAAKTSTPENLKSQSVTPSEPAWKQELNVAAGRAAARKAAQGFTVVKEEPFGPTPESRAASNAAFAKNYPTETAPEGLKGDALRAWQESIGNPLPKEEDLGSKVRAANPEPTRAEVKTAQDYKVVAEEPAPLPFSNDDRVQIAGVENPATVKHVSTSSGISVLRVKFEKPTRVPWSQNPVTRTSIPGEWQSKVSAFQEKSDVRPASAASSTAEGAGEGKEVESGAPAAKSSAAVEPEFKYGNTQANIPHDSEAHAALETARARIADSDLAGEGKDVGGNHLTVRYGIKGEDTEGIKKYIRSLTPFEASLGKTEKFAPSEHSDGAAVIKAPVNAPELHKINAEIEKHGEFAESSFPDYKPHATVAYVHPDKADRYVGMSVTEGKKFRVSHIAITDRNGKAEEIPLEGKVEEKPEDVDAIKARIAEPEAKKAPEKANGKAVAGLKKGDVVTFSKTPPGSYLTAGEQFRVDATGKGSVYFKNVKTGAGTSEKALFLTPKYATYEKVEPAEPATERREVIPTEKAERVTGERIAGYDGGEAKLLTPDGEKAAKYRVVEAADLQPSHDAQTFAKNPAYPAGVQERAYDTSKEAQQRVIEQSQKYDPNYTINTNPDAVNGPPVVTPDGVVLGGNSRAMSTQRLYRAGEGNRYKSALLAQAGTFGLDKEAIRGMKEPVLVREVEAPKTVDEMRQLGSQLNKSATGALGVSERAVSAGKSITRDSLNAIAGMMDSVGKDATLRDLLRERGRDVLNALVKDGAITERERPQFVDTSTGGLSEEGKTFAERALLGSVVDDPRLMDSTPKSILNKLDGSLAALASVSPRTDAYNILPLIREALRDHAEIAQRGSKVEDYLAQGGLFGGSERDPAVDAVTRLFAQKPTAVRERLRRFSEDANFDVQGQGTLGMIEQPSPAKAFNDAFGSDLTDAQLEDSIIKATHNESTIGGNNVRETRTIKPTEASAGSVQRSETGEPRPSGESGTGTPKEGEGKSQTGSELDLLADESGKFEPGKIAEAVSKEVEREIKPALDKAGLTLGKAFDELQHLIAPRAGVPIKTLDAAMKLTGAREQHRFVLEQTLQKADALFDKMPREAQVAFVDNYKQGKEQATPELKQIADFIGKTDDATYRAVVEAQVANLDPKTQKFWKAMPEKDKAAFLQKIQQFKADEELPEGPLKDLADNLLSYKDDHFRVLWKTVPGKAEATGAAGVRSVRPLEGSKGFLKQSTLDSMSEGLEHGGEPVSYNPVKMFQLSQADSWRYITAQQMWQDALADGGRVFVKQGSPLPDGFKFVEDRVGNVKFQAASGEGTVQAGRWAMREDWHRLLSNMLSHDYIRESTIGNGLMSVKNNLTAYRLSLSPFHALTTTVSSWSGAVARGIQEIGYGVRKFSATDVVQGVKDVATSPISPYMDFRRGTDVVHYVTSPEEFLKTQRGQDFIQRYPEAAQLTDDLFAAGAKLSLHEDERLHGLEGMRQAIADDRYIAAALKAPGALNQEVMRPLFGYYIPRVKLATFLKDYSFELKDRAADIEANAKTRGEVARKVWDTTENIYGQMNWDARFWNRTFKSTIQLGFRAFTWFAGNARLVKDAGIGQTRELWESAKWWHEHVGGESEPLPSSGPIPRIDPAFAKILGLGMVYMGANAAIQYAMTREKPKDATDLFAARIGGVDANGKPLRVVAPAIILKDAMSLWGQGAAGYLRSKVSDLISGISDVVANEDFRHAMIHNPHDEWWKQRYDDAAHVLGSPIGSSNYKRELQYGESKAKAALGLAGFSPAPAWINQTPLEKEIAKIAVESGTGTMTAEQRADVDLKHSLIGALRNGDDKPLHTAIEEKKITPHEAANLRRRAKRNPLEDRIRGLAFMKNDVGAYHQLVRLSHVKGIKPEEARVVERLKAQKRTAMFAKSEGKEVREVEQE